MKIQRKIKPIDLVNPVFIKPVWSNPRILKQDGAFIISGLNETDEETSFKICHFVNATILIKGKDKARILTELDNMGVNKSSLFPDLQNVGEHLKDRLL